MQDHFRIGEIAEMFDISVRALHLYDKMGLLKPEYTDESSGYRYYSAGQIHKLHTIIGFKRTGFSLSEIKLLFDKNLSGQELLKLLKNKVQYFRKKIDIASFNIEALEQMKASVEASMDNASKRDLTEQEKALMMSRIVCLENLKLESMFSEILWL